MSGTTFFAPQRATDAPERTAMLAERMLTTIVKTMTKAELRLGPTEETHFPEADPNRSYMLYLHVPFCQVLCPYCSFNRYPFKEAIAKPYYQNMRKEMLMLKDLGYNIESLYFGGGTPTIMMDELCETIDLARANWNVGEVAVETNPNHLTPEYLSMMKDRVQRLSVGVQSFDDGLLKQMDRYKKYGSGDEIMERIAVAADVIDSVNVDMIFNFPSQTEEILRADLEKIKTCGARQTTFSPLYASNGTVNKMKAALGEIDYPREYEFYKILDYELAGREDAQFKRSTLWTFTRKDSDLDQVDPNHIDEYQTNYIDYPGIGSGSITHLGNALYVNTFSISDYNNCIEANRMSIMGKTVMSKRDLMRYRFLLDLYKLRLDKKEFKRTFGMSVTAGLPMEMTFMRVNGAFATDDENELTLTERGRYLVCVLYRQFLSGMNNLREQARLALPGEEKVLLFGDEDSCCGYC